MAQAHSEGTTTEMADFAQGAPDTVSPLSQSAEQNQSAKFTEDFDAGQQESSTIGGDSGDLRRNESVVSQSHTLTPSRGGTLKKKRSLSRKGSVKRAGSKKGSRPGSVRSLNLGDQEDYTDEHGIETNSAFFTPVPTSGNPTEILANRFQCKLSAHYLLQIVMADSLETAQPGVRS